MKTKNYNRETLAAIFVTSVFLNIVKFSTVLILFIILLGLRELLVTVIK